MQVSDLKVGDLLVWNDPAAYPGGEVDPSDMGIVLEVEPCISVKDRIALARVYWREEEAHIHTCDGGELDDWTRRGILEVVSAAR